MSPLLKMTLTPLEFNFSTSSRRTGKIYQGLTEDLVQHIRDKSSQHTHTGRSVHHLRMMWSEPSAALYQGD